MVMIKKNGVKDKRVAVPFDSCLSSAVNLPGQTDRAHIDPKSNFNADKSFSSVSRVQILSNFVRLATRNTFSAVGVTMTITSGSR